MTNEQAIDLLDNLIGMVTDSNENDYDTALKMGIKALKELERLDKQVKIYTTDDEHLKLANQDKPILKEELGMSYTKRNEGFYLI